MWIPKQKCKGENTFDHDCIQPWNASIVISPQASSIACRRGSCVRIPIINFISPCREKKSGWNWAVLFAQPPSWSSYSWPHGQPKLKMFALLALALPHPPCPLPPPPLSSHFSIGIHCLPIQESTCVALLLV